MNSSISQLVRAAMFCLLISHTAIAGGRDVGNGGGVWTCRDTTSNALQWIKLMDLFEAQDQWKIELMNEPSRSFEEWLTVISAEIQKMDPEKSKTYEHYMALVRTKRVFSEKIELDLTDDIFFSAKPEVDSCPGGVIEREQVANFHDNGGLTIQEDFWNRFSPMEQAALYVHEAVYASLRAEDGDVESRKAREIVGYLFSKTRISEGVLLLPRFRLSQKVDSGRYVVPNSGGNCAIDLTRGLPSALPHDDAITFHWVDNPYSAIPCGRVQRKKSTTLKCDYDIGFCEGVVEDAYQLKKTTQYVEGKILRERVDSVWIDQRIRVKINSNRSLEFSICERDEGQENWSCKKPIQILQRTLQSQEKERTVKETSRKASGWGERSFQCHLNESCAMKKQDTRDQALYRGSKEAAKSCNDMDGIYRGALVEQDIRCSGLLGGKCAGTVTVECLVLEFSNSIEN